MRVFITGGGGWVGSVTVSELLNHGHQVIGLARSDESAATLKALGADVLRGDIEDHAVLRAAAKDADAILHLAYTTNFEEMERGSHVEQAALQTMGDVIAHTNKPLILTSGTLAVMDMTGTRGGEAATEETTPLRDVPPFSYRIRSEDMLIELAREKGIRGMVVRLCPVVHGKGDVRFITIFGGMAKKNGKAVYIGEGRTRWPAVHRVDAAVLLRLAVEKGRAGGMYHAVAEEGVAMKQIMQTIAKKVGVPAESVGHEEAGQAMGAFGSLIGVDDRTSSEMTRKELGWEPTEIGLLEDIEQNYFL
ncbi:hypothetical protein H2200_001587 [Cladophialophora chaetospira]|uniref:NAD-dependent epimerase/dehydratase domain-containing protein n=1 Tax=Cladophialophora chaetospira TaxID=386627 RepID=A0AA38XL62_9EURO|nr:hypothetical protein H2200_001587 [Cladophialophora chaetospira]